MARYRKLDATQWTAAADFYEICPVDTNSDGFVDRMEFHLFDDNPTYTAGEASQWVSRQGWYAGSDRTTPVEVAPDSRGGVRAASMLKSIQADGSFAMCSDAFYIGSTTLSNAFNTVFGTAVTDSFFNKAGVVNVLEDPYICFFTTGLNWRVTDLMKVRYNSDAGFITDQAGLRMKSFAERKCIDKTPPRITFTIQPLGDSRLYLVFSKPVKFANLAANLQALDGTGTNVIVQTVAAVSTEAPAKTAGGYSKDAILSLNKKLSLAELLSLFVVPVSSTYTDPETGLVLNVSAIEDELGNRMQNSESHRITDLGVNVIDPLYASDGINTDGTLGEGEGALRVFDGTGRLLDRDITIGTQIHPAIPETGTPVLTPENLQLYFDVNPAPETMPTVYNGWLDRNLALWLPSVLPSFNNIPDFAARFLSPKTVIDANKNFRNFILPSNDDEIKAGANVEFIFKYGDLYCARLKDASDMTSVDPWRFSISALKLQRGGVTILNNVIDSNKREKTLLNVEMAKSGNLVIQVFTMDGNLIRTLERNKKGAGTYSYSWDGSNLSGNPVARGMYFIRVVGPDMDEIRKVMVVKE